MGIRMNIHVLYKELDMFSLRTLDIHIYIMNICMDIHIYIVDIHIHACLSIYGEFEMDIR